MLECIVANGKFLATSWVILCWFSEESSKPASASEAKSDEAAPADNEDVSPPEQEAAADTASPEEAQEGGVETELPHQPEDSADLPVDHESPAVG